MTILQIAINNFYLICPFQKLTNSIVFLISLNKMKLNIIILLVLMSTIMFSKKFFIISYISTHLVLIWKFKLMFFIKFFFFGFFKSHLVILYIAFIIVSLNIHNVRTTLQNRLTVSIWLGAIAFILGGRWALYLYNWGFYWTSDSIEYIIVLIISIGVFKTHSFANKVTYTLIKPVFIIILLTLLRSGLIFTKHNFFQRNQTYLWLLTFLSINLMLQIFVCTVHSNIQKYTTKLSYLFIILFVFITFIWLNKINYKTVKQIISLLFLTLCIFFLTYSINIPNWLIVFQHWIIFLILIYLNTVSILYLLSYSLGVIKYTIQYINLYEFTHFSKVFKNVNLQINLITVKNNNILSSQKDNFTVKFKKLINYYI